MSSNTKVVKNTISDKNHMQVMADLGLHGGFVFAHGKPQPKVKKSH